MSDENRQTTDAAGGSSEARRAFLKRCGKYAIITPPAASLLLDAASTPAEAAGLYGKSKGHPPKKFHKPFKFRFF